VTDYFLYLWIKFVEQQLLRDIIHRPEFHCLYCCDSLVVLGHNDKRIADVIVIHPLEQVITRLIVSKLQITQDNIFYMRISNKFNGILEAVSIPGMEAF
jgi:hypothetical protein